MQVGNAGAHPVEIHFDEVVLDPPIFAALKIFFQLSGLIQWARFLWFPSWASLTATGSRMRCTLAPGVVIMTGTVWVRPVAFTAAILFLISWVFPIGAGLAKDTSAFPKWWGPADVGLAFMLAIVAFGIQNLVRGKVDPQTEDMTYRIYRGAIHVIIAVGGLVMLAGGRINWANCATGLLWRAWLGLYILPWWLVAIHPRKIVQA